jgi:alanine racemase
MASPAQPPDSAAARAGAFLTIDLKAVQANYRRLNQELGGVACAAVVKANAYGLGLERVAPALAAAGAGSFFVALPDEGIALRQILAESAPEAEIFLLNGPMRGAEADYLANGLIPVLNSLDDLDRWRALASVQGRPLAAVLHVDTGMSRLGLTEHELDVLAADHGRLEGLELRCVMSHLACAEEASNPMNARQLKAFRAALARLPRSAASLANSSGIFLGPDYHFDLGRPGAALYGINPTPSRPNPMSQVVRLQGKILQLRVIDAPQCVGYGATHRVSGPTRLATVAVGYADGYLRSLSNRGCGHISGVQVPVVGRVSMDLVTFDLSSVPAEVARPGATIDLLDPDLGVDELGVRAGTIGYEILTALGRRYHRSYLGG